MTTIIKATDFEFVARDRAALVHDWNAAYNYAVPPPVTREVADAA